MNLDFSNLVSTVGHSVDLGKIEGLWTSVFLLSHSDEDYLWAERFNLVIGQFRSLLDDPQKGAVFFGETAAHIFVTNLNGEMDIAMSKFKDRFQNVDADARQAFNDNLGEIGS